MTENNAHHLVVSNNRSATPGVRIAVPGAPKDVNITYLKEIIADTEANLELTNKALDSEATRELAQATRAALLGLQSIAYHLAELHMGISQGAINYDQDPISAYGAE